MIIPSFIAVVRMYRSEFDLTYDEAKARAIKEFEKRGWPHLFQKPEDQA